MCNHYYYSHPACGHTSEVRTQPCEAAETTGTNCAIPPGGRPLAVSRDEPCPGCLGRAPGDRFEVGYAAEVYRPCESGADGVQQGQPHQQQQRQYESEEEGESEDEDQKDDDDDEDEHEAAHSESAFLGHQPPMGPAHIHNNPDRMSTVTERTEATRVATRPIVPVPSAEGDNSEDFRTFSDAALDEHTERLWADRDEVQLLEAIRLSKLETHAILAEKEGEEVERAKQLSLQEAEGHHDYRIEMAIQQSAKDADEHQRMLEETAHSASIDDAEAHNEILAQRFERDLQQARLQSVMEFEELQRARYGRDDDGSSTVRGGPSPSVRSQQTSFRHVDDEASDLYSRAGFKKAGKAREHEPTGSPKAPNLSPQQPSTQWGEKDTSILHSQPGSSKPGKSRAGGPTSPRATTQQHWAQQSAPQIHRTAPSPLSGGAVPIAIPSFPATDGPRIPLAMPSYPMELDSQIPAPPLRSPSPAATIRQTMSNQAFEEQRRRELYDRSPLRPPASQGATAGQEPWNFSSLDKELSLVSTRLGDSAGHDGDEGETDPGSASRASRSLQSKKR